MKPNRLVKINCGLLGLWITIRGLRYNLSVLSSESDIKVTNQNLFVWIFGIAAIGLHLLLIIASVGLLFNRPQAPRWFLYVILMQQIALFGVGALWILQIRNLGAATGVTVGAFIYPLMIGLPIWYPPIYYYYLSKSIDGTPRTLEGGHESDK